MDAKPQETGHSTLAEMGASLLLTIAWVVGVVVASAYVPASPPDHQLHFGSRLAGVRPSGQLIPLMSVSPASGNAVDERDGKASLLDKSRREPAAETEEPGDTAIWLGALAPGTPVFSSDGSLLGSVRGVAIDAGGTVRSVNVAIAAWQGMSEAVLRVPATQVEPLEDRAILGLTADAFRASFILGACQ